MSISFANRRPAGCPTALRLDELAAGDLQGRPEAAAVEEHVQQCAACRQRLESRAADPILPLDHAPHFTARAARPRARRWPVALGTAVVIASSVAGLLLVFDVGHGPHPGAGVDEPAGWRPKGSVALTVHIRRASGVVDTVNDEDSLEPGDQVRFSLVTGERGHAVVLGLDASPAVTVYTPAAPGAGAVEVEPGSPAELPGAGIADRIVGLARVVAVVCPNEVAPEVLRRKAMAALDRAGNRPEAVSSLGTGCLESSVLLRRERR